MKYVEKAVANEKLAVFEEQHYEQRKEFVVFLSHCKREAGEAARVMKALFRHTIPQFENPCYLDSDDLANLHDLFRKGVKHSEVLMVLATENVCSRPWCLAEIYCAAKLGMPFALPDEAIAAAPPRSFGLW